MKQLLLLLFVSFSIAALAQGDEFEWKEASKESQAYHAYRIRSTIPPYGLAKVQGLIKKIKWNDEDETEAMDKKAYDALSLREKFTYTMIHPESFSQNCDAMPPIQDEQKKIFAYIADAFDEYAWSERQRDFLTANRDSVMTLIKESVTRSKRMGANYKQALVEINAKEMVPFLIDTYKTIRKDKDILTLLMQLMKDNEYKPFLSSASFTKLYGDDASYQAYLNYNTANEELIIKRATEFYNGLSK